MRKRRRMQAGVFGLVLSGLLAGCGGTVATPAKVTPVHLSVGYVTGTEVEFFYALHYDLFARAGIDVTPVPFTSGPPMLAALASGSLDAGIFGLPPVISSLSQKVPLKIWDLTDAGSRLNGLYVNPASGITGVKGLGGKTVATAVGTTADVIMHIALQKAGVPFSSVHFEYLTPPALVDAYVRGDVGAVWIWNSWGMQLEAAGAREVANATEYGQGDPGVAVSLSSFIQSHLHTLAVFAKVLSEASAYVDAHRTSARVVDTLSRYNGISTALDGKMMRLEPDPSITIGDLLSPSYQFSFLGSRGFATLVASEAAMLQQIGIIKTVPTAGSEWTARVVEAAAKL